jgi:hypothetical protein
MGLFSGSIPPLFVLSHSMPIINTMGKLALFWRFSITVVSALFNFTDHWLLTTILPSHAPRRVQRVQVVRRPSSAGYCLTPTAELRKIEWA